MMTSAKTAASNTTAAPKRWTLTFATHCGAETVKTGTDLTKARRFAQENMGAKPWIVRGVATSPEGELRAEGITIEELFAKSWFAK